MDSTMVTKHHLAHPTFLSDKLSQHLIGVRGSNVRTSQLSLTLLQYSSTTREAGSLVTDLLNLETKQRHFR